MKRPVGVQKPDRKSRKGVTQSPRDGPVQYHPAPVLPGQNPRFTALSAEARYSDELFDRYPPPKGWTEEDLRLIKAERRGLKMRIPSPTLDQLRSWSCECYEQFCILNAYELP